MIKSPLSIKGALKGFFRGLERRYQSKAMYTSYDAVFRAGGSTEVDRDRVLADLAQKSGWGRVSHPTGKHEDLYELGVAAGKQEVFGHIYNLLRLSPQEIAALEVTVRADLLKINEFNDESLSSQY